MTKRYTSGKKILLSILIIITGGFHVNAQCNLLTGSQYGLFQSHLHINPAYTPEERLTLAIPPLLPPFPIPSFAISVSSSAFALSDIIKPGVNGKTLVDTRTWLQNSRPVNSISASLQMDLFSAGFRLNERDFLSLQVSNRAEMNLEYSKDMLSLLLEGNGAAGILGKEQSPRTYLDGIHYTSIGIGYSKTLMAGRLQTGIRISYLSGQEHIRTEKADISLMTDAGDFTITGSADIILRTSGMHKGLFQGEGDQMSGKYFFNTGNNGWGMDAGFQYRINDRWKIAAAINDLGYIKWKNDVRTYSSKEPGAVVKFEGVDLIDYTNESMTVEEAFQELTDSLKGRFDLVENTSSYSSMLNLRTSSTVTYSLSKKQSISLFIENSLYNKRIHPDVSLSYSISAGKWLNTSIAWSFIDRTAGNLGLFLSINPGPFQWYISSDNILGLAFYDKYGKVPVPAYTRHASLRMGFNLTIGKKKPVT